MSETMILSFAKPDKTRSTEQHNRRFSSDCGVEGAYVSNMSQDDKERWKAKVTGTRDRVHRIELRKEVGYVNMLIVVNGTMSGHKPRPRARNQTWEWASEIEAKPHHIRISANGTINLSPMIWDELNLALEEARAVLARLDLDEETAKATMKVVRTGDHPLEDR